MDRMLIVIPAYNESKNIKRVLQQIKEEIPGADIVVIDDGSDDDTSKIVQEMGVSVVRHLFNLGIGGAMQTGYRFADEKGYDIAVQVDADGQHNPGEIAALIEPLKQNKADIVIGSRFIEGANYRSTIARKLGIAIFSRMMTHIMHQRVTDTTSGFRAVNRRVITFFANDYPYDYPEVEALLIGHRAKFRIQEIPVTMNKRSEGRSSITSARSIYYMIKVSLAIFINLLREKPNRRQ